MNFNVTPEDLEGLPDELLNELSTKEKPCVIIDCLNYHGGAASLDQMLVFIYKKTGKVMSRRQVNARVYKKVKSGHVKAHDQRGVYQLAGDL